MVLDAGGADQQSGRSFHGSMAGGQRDEGGGGSAAPGFSPSG
jgi:hypothetical protein